MAGSLLSRSRGDGPSRRDCPHCDATMTAMWVSKRHETDGTVTFLWLCSCCSKEHTTTREAE